MTIADALAVSPLCHRFRPDPGTGGHIDTVFLQGGRYVHLVQHARTGVIVRYNLCFIAQEVDGYSNDTWSCGAFPQDQYETIVLKLETELDKVAYLFERLPGTASGYQGSVQRLLAYGGVCVIELYSSRSYDNYVMQEYYCVNIVDADVGIVHSGSFDTLPEALQECHDHILDIAWVGEWLLQQQ